MTLIEVPDYVATTLKTQLGHPSSAPDALERSLRRTYRLIAEALKGLYPADWLIVGEPAYRSPNVNEPTGLERFKHGYVVFGEERGNRSMLALFKSDHLAAKYFVWLVSKGQRQIDWSLFLEMEP